MNGLSIGVDVISASDIGVDSLWPRYPAIAITAITHPITAITHPSEARDPIALHRPPSPASGATQSRNRE